jgi:hypothetical protein
LIFIKPALLCKFTTVKIFVDPWRRQNFFDEKEKEMPDIQKAFARKQAKGDTLKSSSGKRKSSEVKEGREISSPNTGRKRKLDQIQHVPTLVSSTFNPLEEVDFPRGGSALTPLEKKEAENEGIRDALFEVDYPCKYMS